MKEKSRRAYIKFGRIQKLRATPGCRACLAFTPNHTPECVARHQEACGKKDQTPIEHEEKGLEELLDEQFPPGLDFEYEPSIASHDRLDDDEVPECPPPDAVEDGDDPVLGVASGVQEVNNCEVEQSLQDEEPSQVTCGVSAVVNIAQDLQSLLDEEDLQKAFGEVLIFGSSECQGAVGLTGEQPHKLSSGRHTMTGGNVLFEFARNKDSNLGAVGSEHGVRVIRLCKEDIDLECPESIEQLIEQARALPGCSIHCSIGCRPWSQRQRLSQAKHPCLYNRSRQERAYRQ